jgi:hypothetical protein
MSWVGFGIAWALFVAIILALSYWRMVLERQARIKQWVDFNMAQSKLATEIFKLEHSLKPEMAIGPARADGEKKAVVDKLVAALNQPAVTCTCKEEHGRSCALYRLELEDWNTPLYKFADPIQPDILLKEKD